MARQQLKTALITGAAKRIGRAIAKDLSDAGFAVAIHAHRSVAEADSLAAELRAGGGKAVALVADLADSDAVTRLMREARTALGPIGLLVNNASAFHNDTVHDFQSDTWNQHFDLHVKAPSLLIRELAAQLPPENSALVVNIIDQRVWAPNPRFFSYTLSKAAMWMATQTLAQALAPAIRVNALGPGPSVRSERQDPADFQAQIDGLILKEGPKLEEFGRSIRFLFDTPSITGQMIAIDGGQHLAWETPDIAEIVE